MSPRPAAPVLDVVDEPNTWRLTWGDRSWTENDLTGAHMAVIVLLHGGVDDWSLMTPASGPIRLMAMLAAFVVVDTGRDVVEVNAEISAASATRLLAALTIT